MSNQIQNLVSMEKVQDVVWNTLMNNSHLLKYATQEQQMDVINELADAIVNDLGKANS